MDKSFSNKAEIKCGVPQGSILGPLLFFVFINDLAFVNDIMMVLFADDTTIYDSYDCSYDSLLARFRLKFDEIHLWIKHNNLEINWPKTKLMLINNHSVKPVSINLLEYDTDVVTEFKLLGVHTSY